MRPGAEPEVRSSRLTQRPEWSPPVAERLRRSPASEQACSSFFTYLGRARRRLPPPVGLAGVEHRPWSCPRNSGPALTFGRRHLQAPSPVRSSRSPRDAESAQLTLWVLLPPRD